MPPAVSLELAKSCGYFVSTMVVYLTVNQMVPGSIPGRDFLQTQSSTFLFLLPLVFTHWFLLLLAWAAFG